MKIFTSEQLRNLDSYTIEHEPISSIGLMERAAKALTKAIVEEWPKTDKPIVVFAGPGNNGGDALAVSRMLAESGYQVSVYLFNINNHLSDDCATNKARIIESKRVKAFVEITSEFEPPKLESDMLVIDGLFGTGLNKALTKGFASLVRYINASPAKVISLDMPSGLMTEDNSFNAAQNIIKADTTLTLHTIKLAFLFAGIQQFIGKLKVLDIGLSKEFIDKEETQFVMLEQKDIAPRMLQRNPFAHKGNMGKAMIIAGSYGMAGAAILMTQACLRSGAGKVMVYTPTLNYAIMQTSVPEAIVVPGSHDEKFTEAINTEDCTALGIGPGLGQDEDTAIAFISQLRRTQAPVVADADALNILSNHRAWMQQLPKGIILTPHPKEFDRMAGNASSDEYERLTKARDLAEHLQANIILKGHYSALCTPEGKIYFNTTGNAGMATAGSGDVLTGIITGLLARGYRPKDASIVGMYLHGLAGDLAAATIGEESLVASDIIRFLPKAFKKIMSKE
ncbi:MAG: NAD(P)H-hydrate dehydratase [Prevotella sp.]|nr:NAD(P)H-hydrate dehydratase [Prevotella sp.]